MRSNISSGETDAIKTLIQAQRNREIIIKPCNKGEGIIVANFDDFLKTCTDYLESKVTEDKPDTVYQEIKPDITGQKRNLK